MKIGKKAGEAPPSPPGEWRVSVAVSVLAHVPNEVLRAWLAVEAHARDKAECWPSNRALMSLMGVGSIRVVQGLLEKLSDHGIAVRRAMPGNRRILVLVRRTAAELSKVEWDAMVDQAERHAAGRKAVSKVKAAEKKRYKPPTRVVG